MSSRRLWISLCVGIWCFSAPALAEWSSPSPIDPTQSGALFHPRCCADAFGNVHALIMDKRSGVWRTYYTRFDGIGWTTAVNLSAGIYDSDYCDIVCDRFGKVHVVFDGHPAQGAPYRVYYKTWPAGQTPGPGQTDISGGSVAAVRPQIAVDSLGWAHVVYYDLNGAGIYYVNNVGGSWSSPLSLYSSGYYPAIAVGPDDTCHIVFEERGTGQYNIYYKKRTAGGTWSGRRLTNAETGVDYETPTVGVDSAGNVLAVYRRDDTSPYRLWGHKWTAPAGPWVELPNLGGVGTRGAWPRIDVDENDTFHIVSQSGSPYDIYYCSGTIAGIGETSSISASAASEQTPDVTASGPGGWVTAIWHDGAAGRIFFSRKTSYIDVSQVRTLQDGVPVWLKDKVASATFSGFFYISDPGRCAGIRVQSGASVNEGAIVEVRGIMATANGERLINATAVTLR